MATPTTETIQGFDGERFVASWHPDTPRYVAVLVHGYGEHIGRYEHVAARLVDHGAVVYGLDHVGHGRSAGERVLIEDIEDVVTDLGLVVELARARHPGLPVVMIGHSMGGLIAARYAQRSDELRGLVLSGPVLGSWAAAEQLLAAPQIPDAPIDPATLSRDPSVGQQYLDDPLVWHGSFRRTTLEALVRSLSLVADAGDLGELPVLWVHGHDDQLVPIEPSRAGVAALVGADRLTAVTYPGARHEVFNETNRDEVLTEVTRFVDGVLA